jgi:hypothetical protein
LQTKKEIKPGSADREEWLNKIPHFIYHFEKKKHRLSYMQQPKNQGSQEGNIFLLQDMHEPSSYVSRRMFRKISYFGGIQKLLD